MLALRVSICHAQNDKALGETLIKFRKIKSRACPELAEGFFDFAKLPEKAGNFTSLGMTKLDVIRPSLGDARVLMILCRHILYCGRALQFVPGEPAAFEGALQRPKQHNRE
jgi:hypothetical protein